MIHLLHLVTHPIQYFAPLYRALSKQPGVELTVLFGSRHGLQPSFDKGFGQTIQFDVPLLDGYRHRFLPNIGSGVPDGGFGNFDCPELPAILAEARPDALWVHGWGYRMHWQAIRAARAAHLPYLIRGETNLLLKPKYSLRWLASRVRVGRMLRAAAGCLYIGSSNRDFYASMGVARSRLHPAHYSIDAGAFAACTGSEEMRRQVRADNGTPPGGFVAICSAKAIARKRLQDAIRAIGRLGPDAHLWILGDGPLRPGLEALGQTEAPGRVHWHGFVNQSRVPALLAAADVSVMPSEDEPWGLAVNEAMACGLPAICSTGTGCAADLVRPGETGYLYLLGNIEELAKYLERLQADRSACARMGRAARDLIQAGYDVRVTAEQITAAVRSVVVSLPSASA
jgi:glycosyltransferase involved in cell wall biosynthesis